MRNILLTGANSPTGKLGLAWLRATYPGASVFAASRSHVAVPGVTSVILDLKHPVPPALPPLDAVLHLASVTPATCTDGVIFERVNVAGAHRLFRDLDYRPGATVLNFSSHSVYAASGRPVIDEDHPKTTSDPYGASKFAFEQRLAELATARGLHAISLRVPVLLAPGIGSNFMSKWRDSALAGRELTLFNPEAPFNACVWWEDLFTLFDRYRGRAGPCHIACNTASIAAMPMLDVAGLFCRTLGVRPAISIGPAAKPAQLISSDLARSLGLPTRTVTDAITLFAEGSRPS